MIKDLGMGILNTLIKVLVQKTYSIIQVQSDASTCDVSCDNC